MFIIVLCHKEKEHKLFFSILFYSVLKNATFLMFYYRKTYALICN